jgi:hypothetical protein
LSPQVGQLILIAGPTARATRSPFVPPRVDILPRPAGELLLVPEIRFGPRGPGSTFTVVRDGWTEVFLLSPASEDEERLIDVVLTFVFFVCGGINGLINS